MTDIRRYSNKKESVRQGLLGSPICRLFEYNNPAPLLKGKLRATRQSPASYIDKKGIVQYKGGSVSTNLIPESENPLTWGPQNVNITLNAAKAPDGTLTAASVIGQTVSNTRIDVSPAGPTTGEFSDIGSVLDKWVTASIFVKAYGCNYASIFLEDNTYTRPFAGSSVTVDLITGQYTNNSSDNYSVQSEYYGDGWWRLSVRGRSTADDSQLRFSLCPRLEGDQNISVNDLNGNSVDGVLVWGAQIEIDTKAANAYVKTTGTGVSIPRFSNRRMITLREERDGWLIEGESRNLLFESEKLDSFFLTKSNVTIPINNLVAPDGTSSACVVKLDTANSAHYIQSTFSSVVGKRYSGSVFLRNGTQSSAFNGRVRLEIAGDAAGLSSYVDVNLNTGAILGKGANVQDHEVRIEQVRDSTFYRVCLTTDAATGAASPYIRVQMLGTSGQTTFTGDGSSEVIAWGFQVEEAAPSFDTSWFASSYIPTFGAQETRARDGIYAPVEHNVPSKDMPQSVFCDSKIYNTTGNPGWFNILWSIGVLTTGSTYRSYYTGFSPPTVVTSINSYTVSQNVNSGQFSSLTTFDGDTAKVINDVSIDNQQLKGATNVTTDQLFITPIQIGSQRSGAEYVAPIYGHIKDFTVYDFALNEEESQYLTGV